MLKERLKDWQDFDVATFYIGVSLGLFEDITPGEQLSTIWNKVPKWVMWSNNKTGNALSEILTSMVTIGALEVDEDSRFRWNEKYEEADWEY